MATSVFQPKEHGSWSLALEPLALGLLVAPSRAGTALALAALAGFFARRPLKAVLRRNSMDRREKALPTLGLLIILASVALLEAVCLNRAAALWPLLLAAPLGGLFLYFDLQNNSRATAAEIVGSSTFAIIPAALATLAGWPAPAALALAVVALARNLPTVLTVRAYVRNSKALQRHVALPFAASAMACASLIALRFTNLIPTTALVGVTVLLVRSAWLLGANRPTWPARRVGQLEAGLGLLYVGSIAVAYHVS